MTPPMNTLTQEVWLEQANLLREIQHLKTASKLLAIGRPERARASEAALDLAKAREAQILKETKELLSQWPELTFGRCDVPVYQMSDHGDQLLWLIQQT